MKLFAITATVALGKITQLKYKGRILDTESFNYALYYYFYPKKSL